MKRFVAALLALLVIFSVSRTAIRAGSGATDPPAWATPKAMAIKRVSAIASAQNEPTFLSNLDCSLVDYRLVASSTMQTGCFSPTAFGLIDSDSDTVIYNGTDEGLPLLPFLSNQVLAPWPEAGNLISLNPALVNGSYISLYKNPVGDLQEQRNLLGQLVSKQLTAAPELRLTDPAGQPLVINPQTLAFSDGGSWLVAEDLNGSFVRINLASLDVLPFAPSYLGNNGYNLLKSQVAVSHDGHYVAINNEATGEFKVYDLTSCSGTIANLAPLNCRSYDYRSFAASQIGGLKSVRHVRFINGGLLSFEATSSDPSHDGIYELAPTASITSLIDYLGLGDSYTSGEGAFDYLSGTDTVENVCHLSAHSYPLLLTRDLFNSQAGHSVACSGAVINDIGSTSDNYRGQVKDVPSFQQLEQSNVALLNSVQTNFVPGYIAQQHFVRQYQPGVTTVSVGGNDIGFGDIVQTCVEPHLSLHPAGNSCFNSYEDHQELERLIDRTVPRWAALYKQLKAEAPGTQFYVIGYPQIAVDNGNCALNVHLNHDELVFTSEIIDYLNGGIAQAATKAGVPYIDISQALDGHRLCETSSYNVAVNGLTAGGDGGAFGINVLGRESYHPNALGHELIEQAILRQTHNLQIKDPGSAGPPDPAKLNQAPPTGRAINTRLPEPKLTSGVTKAGKTTAIKISGSKNGLKPKTAYKVRLDGPAGTVIGTVNSDDSGDVDGTVTVPPGTSGGHTVDVTGDNQADEPADVTQPIYIPVSDDDYDGDGLPNNNDSCPYAVNSGIDSDQDGIDDSCDPMISQPPASGSTGGGNGGTGGQADGPPAVTPGSNGSSADNSTSNEAPMATWATDSGGLAIDEPSVTVAASFNLPDTTNTTRALGSATANPFRLPVKGIKPTAAKSHPPLLPPFDHLPVINWPPWLLLPVLAWFLILLIQLIRQRLNKVCTKNKGFQLQ
ncbi:MAG TPA: GDSL-type esterase/lipase family protein [Candidatus Saccharimonadales bacterium]|jgi:hypothetical protein|nr:GDSL-type esterase/lipase family protein [Candidatus Saccharimonadales bacterium]